MNQKIQNLSCDGGHCETAQWEVRLLPYGGGGNLILCRACYDSEMQYRGETEPKWEDLKVYDGGK